MVTATQMQEHFEIYLQTLISQALDPNFLEEIFLEQGLFQPTKFLKKFNYLTNFLLKFPDDYFLSKVKLIDEYTESRKNCILISTNWSKVLTFSLCTWPLLETVQNVHVNLVNCMVCNQPEVRNQIKLSGRPYNPMTLQEVTPDERIPYIKVQKFNYFFYFLFN